MYLSYIIRPDISFVIRQLSKYNTNSQIGHIKVAKKVIHYLKNTMHLDLIYNGYFKDERETKAPIILFSFELIRYGDSSYARDFKNKKFVMKYY